MEDNNLIQKNVELQRQWYGEPLGDRVRRLVVAFDVSQAYLAEVLGISAPMLSQVMSGRRAKIGNPAVLARMIMLERTVLNPGVVEGDPDAIEAVMQQIKASNPTVGRDGFPVQAAVDERTLLTTIRDITEGENLAAAADLLDPDYPALADLLRRVDKS